MIHIDPESPSANPEIKQVEFNTIASSFGGLSSRVSALHEYIEVIPHVKPLLTIPDTFTATSRIRRHLFVRFPSPKILVSLLLLQGLLQQELHTVRPSQSAHCTLLSSF
jgi:Eukaryotic glutathione synthase, ATP binding domain